jgi:alpha-beta hydrolase superfamily lysophospholipase
VSPEAVELRDHRRHQNRFLLGHSAGGVIACSYTLEHQDDIAGLICEDFAYQRSRRELRT